MKIRQRENPFDDAGDFSAEIPEFLRDIYRARGVNCDRDLGRRLADLPGPQLLAGLEDALDLLDNALRQRQRILVVGDFDADGATSTALTLLALRAMGAAHVDFLVPDRFEYGYGLSPEIVELALDRSPDLLITVDNGISSHTGVERARAAGIRVLVTDHHLPGESLPAADAIVNPNQPGCAFPSKNLAGVGVVFYLLAALRTRLRDNGWFRDSRLPEPAMADWLDLVALGTVADVVPLDAVNRILVHQGLRRIRTGRCRQGIVALLEAAGREPRRIAASDLGFAVGPRLNAAGRLDDMSHGIACLLAEDPHLARERAAELDQLNRDRRIIETGMQAQALKLVDGLGLGDESTLPWGLCLHDDQWHQGVIGLLASRIKDRLHRPVIAFADAGNGELKGSARSIPALHIRDTLDAIAARHPHLLSKFGGHAMAAGMSIGRDHLADFSEAFDAEVRRRLSAGEMEREIWVDRPLTFADLTLDNAALLRDAGPWGQNFPEPLFRGEFFVVQQRVVGGNHFKFLLAEAPDREPFIDGIAFNVDSDWPRQGARRLDALYRLSVNSWRGRESSQLLIERILELS